ncbi:hypothetical protein EZI54_08350 [Marinobacter halodurans]|uniref:Acetyltransferase n=1 Tax=Marinobacter halodurans TaxID=2528979 RepID=A0ABY1ZLI9_9GAMM|nr:hypothetical protein [Marinobacter halodurans]TBW56654.1 hypothetical protein EZI54_08350 [Marinobacter halodurans]
MKRDQLIIYGNGHMARMMAEIVSLQYEVVAFTVERRLIEFPTFRDLPLVPFEDVEERYAPSRYKMLVAVGYTGMNRIRIERCALARSKGYRLANFVDRSVRLYPSTELGDNNIILEYAVIHPWSQLGCANFLSSHVNLGHGTIMGDGGWLNSGVAIGGETRIGDRSVFGMNASAAHGIDVAPETFVAANTFLAKSSEAGDVLLSDQAIRHRFKSETFLRLMKVV